MSREGKTVSEAGSGTGGRWDGVRGRGDVRGGVTSEERMTSEGGGGRQRKVFTMFYGLRFSVLRFHGFNILTLRLYGFTILTLRCYGSTVFGLRFYGFTFTVLEARD